MEIYSCVRARTVAYKKENTINAYEWICVINFLF